MVEMADNEFFVTKREQKIQQRDGITATRDADEVAAERREVAEELCLID